MPTFTPLFSLVLGRQSELALAIAAALAAATVAASAGVQAAENASQSTADDEYLPRITVSGQPLPDLIDTIDRVQATDIRDIFAELANVDIGGGTRVGQRIYLRGIETTNLNITVDGARQGQNLANHRGGLSNIDPAILRQVDVQPGPPAADQGHAALGGSIRMETIDAQDGLEPGRRFGGFVRTAVSSADDTWRKVGAAYLAPTEQVGLLAFHSRSSFDDLRIGGGERVPFSGGRDRTELLRLSLIDLGVHSLRFGAERNEASGLNFFNRADYPWQLQVLDPRAAPPVRQALTREQFTGEYRFEPDSPLWAVLLKVYDRSDTLEEQEGQRRFFESQTTGFDLRNISSFQWRSWSADLTVGMDYFEQDGLNIQGTRGPRRNRYENLGLFVQNRMTSRRGSLSFGVRHDDFETTIRDTSSGRTRKALFNIGGDYELLAGLKVFAGYGESARGAGTIPIQFVGNAVEGVLFNGEVGGSLNAETSESIEAGISWQRDSLFAAGDRLGTRLTSYRTRIFDPVVYVQPGTGGLGGRPVTEFLNADERITFEGVELQTTYDWDRWNLSLGLARMRTLNLPNQPQFLARFGAPTGNRAVLNIGYRLGAGVDLGYTLTGVRRLSEVQQDQIVFIPRPGYSTHDLFINWTPTALDAVSVRFAVRNLFDREYAAHSTFTQDGFATAEAGRDVRLSLGYTF
ncbi:MAG: TonB-dependent receptor plug domain-containing protein [Wenzhouxiangella sp.]